MSDLYCDDCGFAFTPECMCKIPGKAVRADVANDTGNAVRRAKKSLPVHDAGPYRDPATGRVMTSHKECDHEKTKAARAACRKARAAS
jgi:hypothetical protein